MKYVILIHSNPQPWGHPTGDYLPAFQALPKEQQEEMTADFERLLSELDASGELIRGEALGDPSSSAIFRWSDGAPIQSDGPYSETKEQFAGFFLVDVATRERAEELGARFASPGETIEVRPVMWSGGDD